MLYEIQALIKKVLPESEIWEEWEVMVYWVQGFILAWFGFSRCFSMIG